MAVLPLLKALVEPVRIRLYLLVQKSPLTVSEISEILEVSQSNASHHVKALKDLAFLTAEKIGQHTFYGLAPAARDRRTASLLENLTALTDEIPEAKSDAIKLNSVIAARRGDTFNQWRMDQPDLPYSDIFAHLAAGRHDLVVDIGCGEGDFFSRLATSFSRVIGIDIDHKHLSRAVDVSTRAARIQADASALPVKSGIADAAILRMALSQMPDMAAALAEAVRIVRQGGYVSIIDVEKKSDKSMLTFIEQFVAGQPNLKIDLARSLPRLLMVRLLVDGLSSV